MEVIIFITGIVLAAAAAGGIALFFVKKKGIAPPATLREYMARREEPLTEEEAASLLMPAVLELRKLHADGKVHLEITPDTVVVRGRKTTLQPPTGQEAARYRGGFAAPEIYSGTDCGASSDIYSICAVLAFLRHGTNPENALLRSRGEVSSADGLSSVIDRGMEMDASLRYSSMQELINALAPFNTGAIPQRTESDENGRPGTWQAAGRKRTILLAAVAAACAVVVIVGSVTLWTYTRYQHVVALTEAKAYKEAKDKLNRPLGGSLFDSKLEPYLDACILLEDQKYADAAAAFAGMGTYRDSVSLAKSAKYALAGQFADASKFDEAIALYMELAETGYRDAAGRAQETRFNKANYLLLEEGDYKAALEAFNQLQEDGYPGAADKAWETVCLWAIEDIQNKNYPDAFNKLDMLDDYSDALREALYLEAVDLYHNGSLECAKSLFDRIPKYERTGDYLLLIRIYENTKFEEADCQALIPLIGFEDAADLLLMTHSMGKLFLQGEWKNENSGKHFTMKEDGHINYNIPWIEFGDYYYIADGNVLLYPKGDKENTKVLFRITIIDANCVDFYCEKDGSTHCLYRQK